MAATGASKYAQASGGNLMGALKVGPGVIKTVADLLRVVFDKASRAYGIVHRAEVATINGKDGFLIWDWVIANEITFLPSDGGEIVSFLVSLNDEATAKRFDDLVRQYGRNAS
jgi:hypothetical protein